MRPVNQEKRLPHYLHLLLTTADNCEGKLCRYSAEKNQRQVPIQIAFHCYGEALFLLSRTSLVIQEFFNLIFLLFSSFDASKAAWSPYASVHIKTEKNQIEWGQRTRQFTCRSGAQHASVVDSHWAVGAAHGQIIRHKRRNGYGGCRPPAVYQDVLKTKQQRLRSEHMKLFLLCE